MSIWEEKPRHLIFLDPGGNKLYHVEDMDAWLEKVRDFYHDWIANQKTELDEYITKFEALKEGLPNLTALDISIRDAEYILKVLTVIRHEVRGLTSKVKEDE